MQKVLARWFFNRSSITPQQLETAIKIHARHEEGADDSQGCLLERKADARLAEVPPRQRIAVDTPCMLEAAGVCDPRPAGRMSEPPVREPDSDHSSDGDVERCEVLGWSYVLLSVLTGLACLAALIAGFSR